MTNIQHINYTIANSLCIDSIVDVILTSNKIHQVGRPAWMQMIPRLTEEWMFLDGKSKGKQLCIWNQ